MKNDIVTIELVKPIDLVFVPKNDYEEKDEGMSIIDALTAKKERKKLSLWKISIDYNPVSIRSVISNSLIVLFVLLMTYTVFMLIFDIIALLLSDDKYAKDLDVYLSGNFELAIYIYLIYYLLFLYLFK